MKVFPLSLGLVPLITLLHAAPSERAQDITEALAKAAEGSRDIVVYQRGSDWNLLGETLHRDLWLKPELLSELGEGFVLVAVDRPEQAGAPSLLEPADPRFTQTWESLAGKDISLPENQVIGVVAVGGASFKKREDGSWLVDDAKAEKNPANESITLTLQTKEAGSLLRLDFLPDASLPNAGCGRASNGNFAISEIEIHSGDQMLKANAVWGNHREAAMLPAEVADGIIDQATNGWNAGGQHRQRRSLLMALEKTLPARATVQVILHCRSQWGQHVPGCLRAAVVPGETATNVLRRVVAAETQAAKNATFTWWDTSRCPRVALVDSEGRAVAADDTPRADLTVASLAQRIKSMRETRMKRDELLVQAEKVQGPQKAELLRQALDALGLRNSTGNKDCYKPIHEMIRKEDPQDVSGAVRWLGFSADPKGGVPWAKPTWQEALDTQGGKRTLSDADYVQALARVDKELADPRNKILSKENIQRMMVAKYHIYKSWKGAEEKRFDIQREIAAFDPSTFWGIGARGYLGMHGRSEVPYLTYGWKASQVKPGINVWRMSDTAYFFDHPGVYQFRLSHSSGASQVKIKRLALMAGDVALAEVRPDLDLGPGAIAKREFLLDCQQWKKDVAYEMVVELEAAAGQTDSAGTFAIEPWFEEKAIETPSAGPDFFRIRSELQVKLTKAFAGHAAPYELLNKQESLRKDLYRYELLRCCGTDAIDAVASMPGGQEFLQRFTNDLEWMRMFLVNDEAKWPESLENLRFLHVNGGHTDHAVYRKLSTAMACAAGSMNRYRLLDRYRDIMSVHQEGLLHASFDALDVREMRWAVPLAGTAKDYQFMVDVMQMRTSDYIGACWGIPYIDPNVYGYSVQGWGYADPWTHLYGTGTGDRPFIVQRQVGGVCGTLSGFGATVSKAHGVMSTTVGQPGHCAYVVRVGLEWPTGNDVFGPETNGASVYEGTGFPTMHRLYEVIHADTAGYQKATELSWVAHVLMDEDGSFVRLRPGLTYAVYDLPGGNLAEIAKRQPVVSGPAKGFDLAAVLPASTVNFGVVWQGEIEIGGKGAVMVLLQSDDASRLLIDDKEIPRSATPSPVSVAPGIHKIRLEYGQAGGAYSLSLRWLSAPRWNPQWTAAYGQAIAAQPINYPIRLECIKAWESASELQTGTWQKMILSVASAMAPYGESAWALINRCYAKAATTMSPAERMALLLQCHREIQQSKSPQFMGFNFAAVLNTQADSLGDMDQQISFFEKLLGIHHSDDPTQNRLFGDVMNWGNSRFSGKPESSQAYAHAMGNFFTSQGDKADPQQLRNQITAAIRKTSEAGDAPAYQLWMAMAQKLLPPVAPGDVHLNPAQAAARPQIAPFAGELLSKTGMLQTSSACQFDRPLSYAQVLDGTAPGWFDTNAEAKAWAQVVLAGDAEINGIVLVNRYEYAPEQEEFQWAAPLRVQISLDGKTWTDVATCDKAEPVMRIDVTGKASRARYVRIERPASVDPNKTPGRLHFRNFLVYGKKLY